MEAPAALGGDAPVVRKPQPPAEKRPRPKSTFIPSSTVSRDSSDGLAPGPVSPDPAAPRALNLTPVRVLEGSGAGGSTVKRFKELMSKSQLDVTPAAEILRQEVMHELIHTEHQYVEGLSFIVQNLLVPCREKELLSRESLATIFLNVEALHNTNSQFLKELEELQRSTPNPPLIDGLGPILLKWAPQFKLYVTIALLYILHLPSLSL